MVTEDLPGQMRPLVRSMGIIGGASEAGAGCMASDCPTH